MNKLIKKYKKRLLILGILSFCLFVFSFIMGIFYFTQENIWVGIFWTLLVISNFLNTYSTIKKCKENA